jgi:hypothetical protein
VEGSLLCYTTYISRRQKKINVWHLFFTGIRLCNGTSFERNHSEMTQFSPVTGLSRKRRPEVCRSKATLNPSEFKRGRWGECPFSCLGFSLKKDLKGEKNAKARRALSVFLAFI